LGAKGEVGEISSSKFWERGGGYHGGVVGGERGSGEKDRTRQPGATRCRAKTDIGRYATGNDERPGADFFDASGGTAQQLFDDGVLKGG
jgi:hypothetical protein